MSTIDLNFDVLRNHTIGVVEYVSPSQIKVLLDLNAPQNTAINTGVPTLFPKINGFVLIPNESGALVGIISWIGIEHSPYPKRKGFKDFDLIDLPFPLRKMSVNPLGVLKNGEDGFKIERGVYSYPSIGDAVVIPSTEQLQAVVENKSKNAKINIGNSPFAANAPVYVDPDKLFGRHVAVLGNTGSGKSCSVAGLIRWSLEAVAHEIKDDKQPNARFIILDPNGEYTNTFDDVSKKVKKFKVSLDEEQSDIDQLKVPAWMWNSFEWSSIAQASGRTQRPILRRALRELRNGTLDNTAADEVVHLRRYYSSCLVSINRDYQIGVTAYKDRPGRNDFGKKIQSISNDALSDSQKAYEDSTLITKLTELSTSLKNIADDKYKEFTPPGEELVKYYEGFDKSNVENVIELLSSFLNELGGSLIYEGPDEDSPVEFDVNSLPNHLEHLSQEHGVQQFLDFLIMRVRTMLADTRMSSIIGSDINLTLVDWLENYIGNNESENGEVTVIDLSLVPPDIVHIVVSVISRILFEALQRYRRKNNNLLPTVLVMEEAHNFINRYNADIDELSASRLCSQTFEKIAKEGRKFGLGLVLSSQRPSELSPTVLSQCNTFLLHRLVNDRDQELVKRMVPDNLGTILNELPVLPTRKAILLGWATPVPVLVDMNELEEKHRPDSKDPDYWDVWTGKEKREIDWSEIASEWQKSDTDGDIDGDNDDIHS